MEVCYLTNVNCNDQLTKTRSKVSADLLKCIGKNTLLELSKKTGLKMKKNGNLKKSSKFKNGERVGETIYYNENG